MQFQQAFHIPGILAGDLQITCSMPSDASLVHVSAVSSNACAATLSIGGMADPTALLVDAPIGVLGLPAEFRREHFSGGEFPHLLWGSILAIHLDHDHNGGGEPDPSSDVTIVLTFVEG